MKATEGARPADHSGRSRPAEPRVRLGSGALDAQLLIRVSRGDRDLFRRAAEAENFTTVSEWLRWLARTRAGAVLGRPGRGTAGAAAGSVQKVGAGRRSRSP